MWFNNNSFNRHILLLGSKNGLNKINAAQIELRIKDAELAHDLSTSGLNDIFELWDCFLMGSSEINKLTLGVQTNNNNKPVVEFSAAKTEENPHLTNHILQLLKSYREPIFPYLLSPDTTIEAHDKFRKKLDEYFKSSDLILEAFFELSLSHEDQAISFFQQAYMLNRSDKTAKKFLNDYFDAILIASPSTPYELTENAKIFFQKIENDTAITLLQKAIALNDQYAPAYFALGLNYEITGDFASAKQMYQKTLLLKPDLQNVQGRLNKVEKILDMELLK